ncbi:MAG TPA: phenylalanine--tRNA ligase beta subunit-related protein [Kofleriaceae bacterium]|nr:phenylalanine--tRNA ligase beta subunit-related protein [Kofleriaceae bacterium]
MLEISVAPHPLVEVGAFVTRLPAPLGELPAVSFADVAPPVGLGPVDDAVRAAVRALLRHGGYKPSGRGKPASEYLAQAAAEGRFPALNPVVDACNVVSLHSGLPISVVDVDRLTGALSIDVCPDGTSYVFNPSGQTIDASGLLRLADAAGPAGTPVKDAQRTKTDATTRATLSIVWGTRALPGRTVHATDWYRTLVADRLGATIEPVTCILATE